MDPGYLVASLATYTSSVAFLSFLYKFAKETSRAPVKRVQLKSAFVQIVLSVYLNNLNNTEQIKPVLLGFHSE